MTSLILTILLSVMPLQAESMFTPDFQRHCVEFVREYWDAKATAKSYKQALASQNEDGSFKGVNYDSQARTGWPAAKHLSKMKALSCAYSLYGDKAALDGYRKALDYWDKRRPVSKNWWFNMVSVQQNMGPGAILIKDDLSEEDIAKVLRAFDNILDKLKDATGRNLIWLAGNLMMRSVLKEDMEEAIRARDLLASEIRINENGEGIRPDWSFHQHGPQLQIGNYGLGFASSLSWWDKALRGTPLQFPQEKMDIIRKYMTNCQQWVSFKGYYDFSACGRLLGPDKQAKAAQSVKDVAARLGMADQGHVGGRYFPYSDFGVYRTGGWYASIRMQSNRTIGFECVNNNNIKGYFSADGALMVRRDGDEYENMGPCMDWKHIPGATTYDNRKPLWGVERKGPYNLTDLVFGDVQGELMAAAMELTRDGLSARKAWFFTPEFIVCLGCGISMDQKFEVVTTLGQCCLDGHVSTSKKWVNHRGVTYVVLDKSKIRIAAPDHVGKWSWMDPSYSDKDVHMNLFDAYISHGKAPKGASYAYVVVPTGESGKEAQAKVSAMVQVLENNTGTQKVKVGDTVMCVNWEKAEIYFE